MSIPKLSKKQWIAVAVGLAVVWYVFIRKKPAAAHAGVVLDPSNDPGLAAIFTAMNPQLQS